MAVEGAPDATWWHVHFRTRKVLVQGRAEVERLRARKRPKVLLVEPAVVHECSICHARGGWTDAWSWYGSYKDIDDGKPISKFCSDECKAASRAARKADEEVIAQEAKWARSPWMVPRGEAANRWSPDQADNGDWRAQHKAKKMADPRAFPFPTHPPERTGMHWCRWCGQHVNEGQRQTWHSACLREYNLHIDRDAQQHALFMRDGPGCAICGIGQGRWVGHKLYGEDSEGTGYWRISWSEPLEVDHIVELWEVLELEPDERRRYFGLENLWMLCLPCHRRKSAAKAAERAIIEVTKDL